jgi:choline transporter-like protein 2/4/5
MMMMLLMPLIQVIGLIAFCAPWVVYMLYLGCSGEVTTVTAKYNDVEYTYIDYVFEQSTYGAFAFMLFVFFWTTQLIIALGQVMIALAVSSWYFSRERALSGTPTVIWATLASLQHVGTAAAGSLLIAICKMIRAVIHYFQKQAAKYPGNACCKALLCMCGCCVWCLEGCIKFLNKNAYIMTALYGYGFCHAASKAFSVLAANIVRVLTVNFISSFVLLLGKMLIPVASSFFAYIVLEYTGTEPTGLFFPVIVVFILAYFVACMFNEIYDMSIETILICFCEDESLFEPGERYAPASLRATIKDTNQKAASNRVAPTPVEAVDAKEFASDPQPAASSDETGFLT